MDCAISIKGLNKKFADITALDDVTIDIPRGSIVGLLGRNGAGKSTLVRLLSGVMSPTSGTASVYGYDLLDEKEDIKRITGLLPEEYALYEKLTVAEYVYFIGTLYDLTEEQIEDRFIGLAEKLDILQHRNRLIETLSKGMKQKVAIITSILHEPMVVFLDEPIANLDVQAQRIVHKIIKEYRDQSRLILIATHLLLSIENICDHIIVIDEGVIRFSGTLDEFREDKSLEDAFLSYMEEI